MSNRNLTQIGAKRLRSILKLEKLADCLFKSGRERAKKTIDNS